MKREHWLERLRPFVTPNVDVAMADDGVVRANPSYIVSFLFPYGSVSGFNPWAINIAAADALTIAVTEYGHETLHIIPWDSIHAVSIQVAQGATDREAIREALFETYVSHLDDQAINSSRDD